MSTTADVEVDRVFARALELKAKGREDYLRQACDGRPELRAAVDELLSLSNTRDDLIDSAPEHRPFWLGAAEEFLGANLVGRRVGPWKVVREIGRGGMGLVFLAERDSGELTQRAALKLLPIGADRKRLRRFTQEGQILADLDHPGIARLLEGGVSDDGWPYLAMEYVDGQPIDEVCDQRGLSLRQRLELFLKVCTTVDAAHRHLVVHRDLKPSNILVAYGDSSRVAYGDSSRVAYGDSSRVAYGDSSRVAHGDSSRVAQGDSSRVAQGDSRRATDGDEPYRVKLLDFGIAKLLKKGDSPEPTFTAEASRVMTPSYASPEQFRGDAIGVASDVYQLGLLLYRLLTGRLPYEVSIQSLSLAEQLICRETPPRASTMVSDGDSFGAIDGRRWRRALRGDLNTILARALRKEPADRYLSAAALAADVRRHLDGLPIEARRPTWPYLARKFVGRHRWRLAVALTVLLLGILQTVVQTRSLRSERDRAEAARLEAERARDASQELSRFLVDLFEINDPERLADQPVDALELMDRATEQLGSELEPLVRARFLHTSGEIYTKLARFERATQLIEEALEIRRQHLPVGARERLESIGQLGVIYSRLSRFDEADVLLRRVLEARREAGDPGPLAMALNNLGNLRLRQRRLAEAEEFHREALEIRQRTLSPGHPQLTDSINNLGVALHLQGRDAEAIPHLQRAAELFAANLGSQHPQRAVALNNLGLAESVLGRYLSADRHLRAAIEIWNQSYGPDHPRTLRARQNLGNLARRQGRLKEARKILEDVLERQRVSVSPEPLEVATTLSILGVVATDLGDYEAAGRALEQALDTRRDSLGIDHRQTLSVRSNLARLAFLRGRIAEAEAAHREILAVKEGGRGPDRRSVGWTLHQLALTLVAQGRGGEARPLLERALRARRAALGEDHPETVESRSELDSLSATGG